MTITSKLRKNGHFLCLHSFPDAWYEINKPLNISTLHLNNSLQNYTGIKMNCKRFDASKNNSLIRFVSPVIFWVNYSL